MLETLHGVPLRARITAQVPPVTLVGLPFDFDRYVDIEPRLTAARWVVGDQPAVGAKAEVIADIPFTVTVVRRLLGRPTVTVTITAWRPPQHAFMTFAGRGFEGWASVDLELIDRGSDVTIDGRDQAAMHGRSDTVRLLIERGADLHDCAFNADGPTPLDGALWGVRNNRAPDGDYLGTVRALLDAGAVDRTRREPAPLRSHDSAGSPSAMRFARIFAHASSASRTGRLSGTSRPDRAGV